MACYKRTFMNTADGLLVAYAKATGAVLITEEVRKASYGRKVKIPIACDLAGVRCSDLYTMLEQLQIRFEWKPEFQLAP